MAEGYTEQEMDLFYKDAQTACDALFSHEPFKKLKNKFNVVAVASPSQDSGVSVPGKVNGNRRLSALISILSIPTDT